MSSSPGPDNWEEALETVVRRTGHEVYRAQCAPDHPDHRAYRRLMLQIAAGPLYPPLQQQAANLARSLWDWAVSGFGMADEDEVARRRSICAACPEWVPADRRCRICGCFMEAKIRLKMAHCPLPEPRW
jgi:hypothetical protein